MNLEFPIWIFRLFKDGLFYSPAEILRTLSFSPKGKNCIFLDCRLSRFSVSYARDLIELLYLLRFNSFISIFFSLLLLRFRLHSNSL